MFIQQSASGQALAWNYTQDVPARHSTQSQRRPLSTVLKEIENRFRISIAYRSDLLEDRTVELKTATFSNPEKALKKALEGQPLRYEKVNENFYLISPLSTEKKDKPATVVPAIPSQSPTGNGAEDASRAVSMGAISSINPKVTVSYLPISGRVVDQNNEAVPGATVIYKENPNLGTSTNAEGQFTLNVPEARGSLVISSIGFLSQEVTLGQQTSFVITLQPDTKSLEEVVVVGYGAQRSQDLTGSVAVVDQKSIRSLPVSTIDQKMIGQVAGVQIQQPSGAPGGGTSIKIRGSGSLGAGNEPLYVVDGMPYSAGMNQTLNPLLFINPNDIESVSILKDASSTAIYGSRGANGVIMITTKKGKFDRTEISVSSMRGVQQVPQKGRPEMLNEREFAELQRDKIGIVVQQREKRAATVDDYPEEYRDLTKLTGKGTDWYGLLLRPAAIEDHNISIQKGTKESRMSASLGYFRQDGVLKYTGVERYSAKLGMESNLGKHVKVSAILQPTFITQKRTNTNASREDILGVSLWANPLRSPYDANGNLIPYIVSPQSKYHSAWSFANPLFNLRESVQTERDFQNLGSAFLEWEIIPGLKAKTSLNTIWSTAKYSQYIPATVGASNTPPTAGIGRSNNTRSERFDWLIENTLTYDKTIGNHRFDALLGYTTQKSRSTGINLTASPFTNDLIQTINAAQTISAWGETVNEWAMISYLGRINYAFRDRYLLTATFRSDGSSRFGSRKRYALFPSFAAAWRVSEEDFLKGNRYINDLKLRASYGRSGNNNIGNYSHLASINAESYVFGTTQVTASSVGLSNPYLSWEVSDQVDVGTDVELFRNRLSLSLDYYYRKSTNMLLNDVIPAITGYNSQTVNKGNIRNTGVEIALGGTPVSRGSFNWDVNLNVAFNRNKVLSLNDNGDRILAGNNDNNPTHVSVVGKPISQFFGYIFDGLYTAADIANPNIVKTAQVYEGNVKYKDVNGDGVITDLLDYTIIGSPHPKFIYGLTNRFTYNRFDLNVIVNGQYGGQVMNGLRQTVDNLQGFFNVSKEWNARWRNADNPGDGRHYGIPILTPSLGHRVSNLWVEDASFLRISNLTLGYSLPDNWVKKTGFVNNCRFYLTTQNLAIFTKYKGANPEAQSVTVNNTLAPGFDMSPYPLARTTSLGVNLTF
ncbi:SusC/RagA family TonB-linked outer membrane protein [Larkinella terrae]|uniref:SusC/RagA family TonB-linked outer membrane protein n=2 Tax=Larkinella terrae TaxID=2025311 RepID=A0A7K0ESE8_9BACT|nr:SusC/RagA family TonB-linked outer membrane protein [Larkinella terrae]